MEEGVPKYLQYEGKVRNRRLGKRDCLLLIKDIWREKAAHDAEVSRLTLLIGTNPGIIVMLINLTVYTC